MADHQKTYTEIINKREAEFVSTLSYEDFFKCFPPEDKGDNGEWDIEDKKLYFKQVHEYILKQMKNNFQLEINYKPSDTNSSGRVFSRCPMSLQRIHKPLREFLSQGLYHDYDMVNCHFVIFNKLCEEAGLSTVYIKNYIENRTRILNDNRTCKTHILAKLNSDNARANGDWNKELKELIKECNDNKKVLHKKFVSQFKQTNQKNPISSIINKKMCQIENNILQQALPDDGYIVPMFDGFMCNKELDFNLLPNDICKWDEKSINSDVKVPDDFVYVPNAEAVNDLNYEDIKKDFEKTHAKIIGESIFIMVMENKILFKTKSELIISYEHISFQKFINKGSFGYYKKTSFIKEWLEDENIRKYNRMCCFPNPDKCPDDTFNLWNPFDCEKYDCTNVSNIQKCYIIEKFKSHILILCRNDVIFQHIIIQYIAHMFQYPDIQPGLVPYFISTEGSGKGTLIKFIERIMGNNKMLSTSSPSKDCFGKHNELMKDAFLIELKEVKKREMIEIKEDYKSLITDGNVNINPKNQKPFSMKCYARLFGASNNEDCVPTSSTDRRNIIIKCSDELIGNRPYFKMINEIINNDSYIRVIYEYLMQVKNVPKVFDVNALPRTDYHKILAEASEDYTITWLKEFIIECKNDENIPDMYRIKSDHLFKSYRSFVDAKLIKCERNYISFMKHLSILDLNGITPIKPKNISYRLFDLNLLYKNMVGVFVADDGDDDGGSYDNECDFH